MTHPVGYTRELAPGSGTEADAEELTRVGAERVFTEGSTGDARTRPRLQECIRFLEPGDTLIVTGAARLSSSVTHFVTTVSGLTQRGIAFQSLSEPALCAGLNSTVDPAEVLVALEGLRRRLVGVQTRAGMASAAKDGRRPGRPTVMTPERVAMAVELRNVGRPITHIARVLGVSANAVQRALAPIPRPVDTRR